ncbi:MAG: transporter substrate-binding domain-containing protein, partial [Desulfovibrio sp.]|nr:transporter substrate-binding domain-containing protein [Desulfovibrio sp.]
MKIRTRRAVCLSLLLACLLCGLQSPDCPQAKTTRADPPIRGYRDIPGVTGDEIAAIEALKKRPGGFTLAMVHSTEAFRRDDGTIGGFSSLFCSWLTALFGAPFRPVIVEENTLLAGLASHGIDFSGDLTSTPERRKTYHMTDAVAERPIKSFRLAGSGDLPEPAARRPLRFAFLKGAAFIDDIRETAETPFTAVYAHDYGEAAALLRSGAVDAFFAEGPAEAAFDASGGITATEYFPLLYVPVSLATGNPELAPLISVVQKSLNPDTVHHLMELYKQGENEYRRHKFFLQLTGEEKDYLRAHGGGNEIPIAVEYDNYPFSFYNTAERQWQGIAIDVLREISAISGLSFVVANEPGAVWSELLGALEEGKVALISELIPTRDRQGRFLWAETPYCTDNFALISRSDQQYVKASQILHSTVAVSAGTAYEEVFTRRFPRHRHTVRFDSTDKCFAALENGEVDFAMASRYRMQSLTSYSGKPRFKVNILFDDAHFSSFGLNKKETILCSIVSKAQKAVLDTEGIADQWVYRVFDYDAELARARQPYLIGLSVMLVAIAALLLTLLRRSRRFTGELAAQARIARDASRAKSDFLSRMSHEIRTPMNVVVGLAEVLLRRDLPVEAANEVRHLKRAGASLLALISDVLDFSKIEEGKLEIADEEYVFSALIRSVEDIIRFRIADRPIVFSTDIDAALPDRLRGDADRVRQILLNLLSNAVKYTRQGSVTFTVSGAPQEDGMLRLSFEVADTGIGIRQEDLAEVFKSFRRLDVHKNSSIEGTGLGLAIAGGLCRAMGGELTARSEYGQGSVFTAVLLQTVADWKTADVPSGGPTDAGRLRIGFTAPEADVLIVDDLPGNLLVVKSLLAPYRMRVLTCPGGREAVELVRARSFDLVLMDHMMPDMDGVAVTRAIRDMDEERCRTMPIVALTANAVSGMKEMFLENGFNDFLSKPVDVFKLDAVLRQWLPPGKRRGAPDEARGHAPEGEREEGPAPFLVPPGAHLPTIAGLDVGAGIARIGGSFNLYLELLAMFRTDAEACLARIARDPDETSLRTFTIQVHAIKSALANIGAGDLSKEAALLEKAGKEADMTLIREKLPAFRKELAALAASIGAAPGPDSGPAADDGQDLAQAVAEDLEQLQKALEALDIGAM